MSDVALQDLVDKLDPCEGCGTWCEDGCPREELRKTVKELKRWEGMLSKKKEAKKVGDDENKI